MLKRRGKLIIKILCLTISTSLMLTTMVSAEEVVTNKVQAKVGVVGVNSTLTVKATGVRLNTNSLNWKVGNSGRFTATVLPANTTNKGLIWTTSNSKVVTIDANGNIKAVGAGKAIITCKTSDGSNKSATCSVTVTSEIVKTGTITLDSSNSTVTNGVLQLKPEFKSKLKSSNNLKIIVPSKINGQTVTKIGANAFSRCYLQSISLPNTIKSIGGNAFSYTSLKSITLPNSLTNIDDLAFNCSNLESITIPNSVIYM